MNDNQVSVLVLRWNINFHDADEGRCFAGEGQRIVRVYRDEVQAMQIAAQFNPVLVKAEKETIVFPVQQFNAQIQAHFGFVLSDVDQDGTDFRFAVENFDLS